MVTIYQVSKLFEEAYLWAAVLKNAVSAFCQTEIFPCNCDIVGDEDFAVAEVTEQPAEVTKQLQEVTEQPKEITKEKPTTSTTSVIKSITCISYEKELTQSTNCEGFSVSPQHIIPVPKAPCRRETVTRKGRN